MHTAGNVHTESDRKFRLRQASAHTAGNHKVRFANAYLGHPDLNSIVSFDATIWRSSSYHI